jgi:hypothetical protein
MTRHVIAFATATDGEGSGRMPWRRTAADVATTAVEVGAPTRTASPSCRRHLRQVAACAQPVADSLEHGIQLSQPPLQLGEAVGHRPPGHRSRSPPDTAARQDRAPTVAANGHLSPAVAGAGRGKAGDAMGERTDAVAARLRKHPRVPDERRSGRQSFGGVPLERAGAIPARARHAVRT